MTYIEDYQPHFLYSHFSFPSHERKPKIKKNKLLNDFDKLFFNFLIIIKYQIPLIYNRHEEKNIKLNIAQNMESFKYKHKDAIINHLCYEEDIDLKVLDCLAAYFKINIIYYYGNVMLKMLHGEQENMFWLNEKKDIFTLKRDKYEDWIQMSSMYYEINDIYKPLYSVSHYKADELKIIAYKMNIMKESDKKILKKDYYEMIEKYIQTILF